MDRKEEEEREGRKMGQGLPRFIHRGEREEGKDEKEKEGRKRMEGKERERKKGRDYDSSFWHVNI